MKMKSFYLLLAVSALPFVSSAQSSVAEKLYVCTPCGYSCDSIVHKSPGTCSSCGMAYVEKATVHFDNISFAQMCERLKRNKNLLLLDVRSVGEFTGQNEAVHSYGHLKGAVNINVTDLSGRLSELDPYRDKEVIVYCSHSHRSPQASYIMNTHGFTNVANVIGGVSILERDFGDNECVSQLFVKHGAN